MKRKQWKKAPGVFVESKRFNAAVAFKTLGDKPFEYMKILREFLSTIKQ